MKKIGFIVQFLCLALFSFGQSAGDGIRFIEGEKWENVLKMAQEQDKYIFMDCYTSWCGPCKVMSKQVFVRKEVGDIFNGMCVNVKIDMEKGEGKELSKKFDVHAYPTFLIVRTDGTVQHRGEIRYSGLSDSVGFISGRTDQVSFTGRNGVRTFCSDRPLCP